MKRTSYLLVQKKKRSRDSVIINELAIEYRIF